MGLIGGGVFIALSIGSLILIKRLYNAEQEKVKQLTKKQEDKMQSPENRTLQKSIALIEAITTLERVYGDDFKNAMIAQKTPLLQLNEENLENIRTGIEAFLEVQEAKEMQEIGDLETGGTHRSKTSSRDRRESSKGAQRDEEQQTLRRQKLIL